MLCQNCGKYEATTHIKRIVNGEATEAHLCSDCARALGYDSVFPDFGFNFSDMLGSFFNEATVGALSNGIVRCEKCGSTFNDIEEAAEWAAAIVTVHFTISFFPHLSVSTAEPITRVKRQILLRK